MYFGEPHQISVSWQSELLVSSLSIGVTVSLCHKLMPVENSSGFAFLVQGEPHFVSLSFSLFFISLSLRSCGDGRRSGSLGGGRWSSRHLPVTMGDDWFVLPRWETRRGLVLLPRSTPIAEESLAVHMSFFACTPLCLPQKRNSVATILRTSVFDD